MTRLQKAEAMWAAAGLRRLKDLGEVARPQTAGLAPARPRGAARTPRKQNRRKETAVIRPR